MKLNATRKTEEKPYPAETWELIELVMAGCPDEPLKAFRKSLIGRGNPLTAREADSSISGARTTRRTGAQVGRGKRAEEPEPVIHTLSRARWYLRRGMAVIFAREQGHIFTDREMDLIYDAREAGVKLTFLEWSDTGVDRAGGP